MQISEKKEIKAVHMTDLAGILKKYNRIDDFTNGDLKCIICSDILSNSNVGSLKLKNDQLLVSCNKTSCYTEMIKKQQINQS